MSTPHDSAQTQIHSALNSMEPQDSLEILKMPLAKLLSQLNEEERVHYILGLFSSDADDKVSSMVHL